MATCEQMCPDGAPSATGTATLPLAVWAPPAPPLVWPAVFPERLAVEIQSTEGGRTLVACEELVSPGNKDRASKQRLFVVKRATHLARGVGVVVIDTVTSGQGNLHNELMDLLDQKQSFRMTEAVSLYTVAYRPLHRREGGQVETWPMLLAVGQLLSRLPLALTAKCCVPVDLEVTYAEACRRRIEDALGRTASG